eukprot:CAMPEP_0115741638 /NCGR_PEP_ID=MMETSP0272-20121206/90109_1 /TAXON_ID=71861 /ORGANISM="Scrippsiella trochoidea, Strain CCMP3099" /LENGTH=268 /DNA_ID=CAMNT_0003186323 /DNA_START=285 /DNA_END=1088 /DNA_ORIENTATION=+
MILAVGILHPHQAPHDARQAKQRKEEVRHRNHPSDAQEGIAVGGDEDKNYQADRGSGNPHDAQEGAQVVIELTFKGREQLDGDGAGGGSGAALLSPCGSAASASGSAGPESVGRPSSTSTDVSAAREGGLVSIGMLERPPAGHGYLKFETMHSMQSEEHKPGTVMLMETYKLSCAPSVRLSSASACDWHLHGAVLVPSQAHSQAPSISICPNLHVTSSPPRKESMSSKSSDVTEEHAKSPVHVGFQPPYDTLRSPAARRNDKRERGAT